MRNTINRERHLSKLQLAILDVLPPYGEGSVLAGAVLDALRGVTIEPPTNAERAAVSRALSRLEQRGLVHRLVTVVCLTGNGYRWARVDPDSAPPEQAAEGMVRFRLSRGKPRYKTVGAL